MKAANTCRDGHGAQSRPWLTAAPSLLLGLREPKTASLSPSPASLISGKGRRKVRAKFSVTWQALRRRSPLSVPFHRSPQEAVLSPGQTLPVPPTARTGPSSSSPCHFGYHFLEALLNWSIWYRAHKLRARSDPMVATGFARPSSSVICGAQCKM